jgi:hypothetical protein
MDGARSAASSRHGAAVRLLLVKGVNIKAKIKNKGTALDSAA